MMKHPEKLSGIVLAGGKSSRMGEDKGLLPLQGKPMVAHVLNQLQPCVEEHFLVANNPEYNRFGCRVVPDLVEAAGPVGGIYTGLRASGTDFNFFVSCDMPFITTAAIRYLLQAASPEVDVVAASLQGRMQPLFALYSKRCIPLLEASLREGRLRLQALVLESKHQLVPLDALAAQHPGLFQNINTPAEFEVALAQMGSQPLPARRSSS